MTQILLEIPRHQDLELLLALIKRLNIRVVQGPIEMPELTTSDKEISLILAGLPPQQDFETYVREFKESLSDNVLPLREN